MAGPASGDQCLELKLTGTIAGLYAANILHLHAPSGAIDFVEEPDGISALYPSLVSGLDDLNDDTGGLLGLLRLMCPVDFNLNSMQLRSVAIWGDGQAVAITSPTAILAGGQLAAQAGLRTGSISASNLSPGLVWMTNSARHQGRMFVMGLSETDVEDNVLTSGLVTAISGFGDLLTQGSLAINSQAGVIAAVLDRGTPGPEFDKTWRISSGFRIGTMIWQQGRRRRPV